MQNTNKSDLSEFIIDYSKTQIANIKEDNDIDEVNTKVKVSDISDIMDRSKHYNKYINLYLKAYRAKQKSQLIMKWLFFGIVLFLLILLIIGTIISMVAISNKESLSLYDISLIITAVAGVITAFIVLPKVIAKNLFPQSDDDNSKDVFKYVMENDLKLRGFYSEMLDVDKSFNNDDEE